MSSFDKAITREALWKSHDNLALKSDAPPIMKSDEFRIATVKRSLSFMPSPEPATKKMRLGVGELGNALVGKEKSFAKTRSKRIEASSRASYQL